ncbi:MAG: hypothetical protein ACKVQV_00100 [Bacteroidia bacterium]
MASNPLFDTWYEPLYLKILTDLSDLKIQFDFDGLMHNPELTELHKNEIEPWLLEFYRAGINGFKITWTINETEESDEMRGSINIWPVESTFKEKNYINVDSKEIKVNQVFGKTDKIKLQGIFRIVDYFVDEAQVGYFSDSAMKFRFYYMDSDQEFWDLKLDFKGYFELACAAYGFEYWQQYILYREYKKAWHHTAHNDFIQSMPEIFPDFKIEEFLTLYESLRLKD